MSQFPKENPMGGKAPFIGDPDTAEINSAGSGFFKNLQRSDVQAELRRIKIFSRRKLSAEILGTYRTAFRGQGLTFSELTEYQPGMDVKRIDWKATSRSSRVYVKSYEEERELRIIIALDISSSLNFGTKLAGGTKRTRAMELAAFLAILASHSNDAVGMFLFSGQIHEYLEPRRARTTAQKIVLTMLSYLPVPAATDFTALFQEIIMREKKKAVVFVLSDFISVPSQQALQMLSLRHDCVLCALEDPYESQPVDLGTIAANDGESETRFVIDSSSAATRTFIADSHKKRMDQLLELCKRSGASLLRIPGSPLPPLRRFMEIRSKTHGRAAYSL